MRDTGCKDRLPVYPFARAPEKNRIEGISCGSGFPAATSEELSGSKTDLLRLTGKRADG
jgi:hypothetical protein